MTIPMLRAIRKNYKDSSVWVVVYGENLKLLLDKCGYTDFVINLENSDYSGFINKLLLILKLRNYGFTHMFLNHIAERRSFLVLGFLAGIPNRIGFDRSAYAREKTYNVFIKFLNKKYKYNLGEKLRTEMNLTLLKELNINDTDLSYDPALRLTNKVQTNNKSKQPVVGIHPGSQPGGELKRWDINNFIELAQQINLKFNFRVKFYIGPGENELSLAIGNKFESIINKKLQEVIEDISNCDYFISNDSGLSHIAASFGIPSLVIFGPTIKNEYLLPVDYVTAERNDLHCRPCFHLRRPCPFNHDCMNITPSQVFNKFIDLVKQSEFRNSND